MRLRVLFGLAATKEVSWYRPIEDFPKLVKYLDRNYEWVFYNTDPTNKVDTVLTFVEVPTYDPNYGVYCPSWNDMFEDSRSDCECGASYSSFSWDHMRFCKKWIKW